MRWEFFFDFWRQYLGASTNMAAFSTTVAEDNAVNEPPAFDALSYVPFMSYWSPSSQHDNLESGAKTVQRQANVL